MSWRDDLRPASFRGVAFLVESHELTVGRRGVTHEFAQREKPYGEDTGRKARQFTVEGYLLGADYFAARDALVSALEEEGAGELIHPYFGRQLVNCFGGARFRESSKDGGMVLFSITFEEAGEVQFPTAVADPGKKINDASESMIDKAKAAFARKFSVDGMPSFGVDDATRRISGFADTLSAAAGRFSARNEALADLSYSIRNLQFGVAQLVQTPSRLADEMAENMRLLTEISNAPREIFGQLKGMFSFGEDEPEIAVTTTTRERQADNAAALNEFVQAMAVAEGARMATEIEYESTEDAAEVRDALSEKLDEQMEVTDDDDVFSSLQGLRSELFKGVPPPNESLATIARIQNQITMPSLVLAYRIYGNVDLEEDLISRNQVDHPAFVPGGRELEVLQIE